jgi:hypothetical protein
MKQSSKVTETLVGEYIKDTPHHYKKGPEIIRVKKNSETTLYIRGKWYTIISG